jgi:hypothetical protein
MIQARCDETGSVRAARGGGRGRFHPRVMWVVAIPPTFSAASTSALDQLRRRLHVLGDSAQSTEEDPAAALPPRPLASRPSPLPPGSVAACLAWSFCCTAVSSDLRSRRLELRALMLASRSATLRTLRG